MNYGSSSKNKGKIDETKLGFKSNLGRKEAMARIILEEIRDFCNTDWDSAEPSQKSEARGQMVLKLKRCQKMLEEDPLGQKAAKFFGTMLNASTDSSIGTVANKVKLTQVDYDLAEEYGIDPEEAYAYRIQQKQQKALERGKKLESGARKTMLMGAEGMYAFSDPKTYFKDKMLDVPPPDDETPICPSCLSPGTFIEKYNRYYCHPCAKYIPKNASVVPAPADDDPVVPSEDSLL